MALSRFQATAALDSLIFQNTASDSIHLLFLFSFSALPAVWLRQTCIREPYLDTYQRNSGEPLKEAVWSVGQRQISGRARWQGSDLGLTLVRGSQAAACSWAGVKLKRESTAAYKRRIFGEKTVFSLAFKSVWDSMMPRSLQASTDWKNVHLHCSSFNCIL